MPLGMEEFLATDAPGMLGVAPVDDAELSLLRNRLPASGFVVREVRGTKMTTVAGVFDEFASAFQFPYYFGENKDAFDECLRDLDEFVGAAAGYVIVVRGARQLLSAEPDQWEWFLDAMRAAGRSWARRPTPVVLRIVLQEGVPAQLRLTLPTLRLDI